MRNDEVLTILNTNNEPKTMTISWMVTTLCNYACDFCIQGDKEKHIKNAKGESRELRDKITAKICRLIEEEYDGKYDHLKIFLIGGEVTILPDCIEIVERLVNTKFRGKLMIHITSNMSADLAWFRDLAKVFEDHPVKDGERHLFLGCSYYKEYVTEEEFISKLHAIQKMGISKNSLFKKVYKKIRGYGRGQFIWMECTFPVATDDDYEAYLRFNEKTGRIGIHTIGTILRNYETSLSEENRKALIKEGHHFLKVEYTDGSKRTYPSIQQMGFDLSDREQFDPRGYYCDAGWTSFRIRNNGTYDRCPNLRPREGFGDFLDESVHPNDRMEICNSTRCSCNYFRLITKEDLQDV